MIDLSKRSVARVVVLTVLGTLGCIIAAVLLDSYSWETRSFRWGSDPLNNVLIPLIIAPPCFWLLLTKMRQLALAQDELMQLATTDSLTNLLNRRAFSAIVETYLSRMTQDQRGSLLVLDLDHFKHINDTLGHAAGDRVLEQVSSSIRGAIRASDVVARMGGEEFAILCPSIDVETCEQMCTRILENIKSLRIQDGAITASIGGVSIKRGSTFEDLYRAADNLLYEAKRSGRDRYIFGHLA